MNIPLDVVVPGAGGGVDPTPAPTGGTGLPGGAADPSIADILAQTGGSPLVLLAALAAAVVIVGVAALIARRRRSA